MIKKTQTIYQIIHEPEGEDEYGEARNLIKSLFKHIVQKDAKTIIGGGFCRIIHEENYKDLFDELIEKKVQEELEEKKKKEKAKEKAQV
ncbi:hypothetical protein [Bacillus sp. XF8]|uniref:hypothetical protein n=1 Tax=Bacillus sp. XF8 TaxID=2819289 RepID=UPI001FB74EB3|nr:hypothetical protein [Bacillus sp. XF8]